MKVNNNKNLYIYNALVEKTKYSWDTYSSFPEYLKNSFAHYYKHINALEGNVKLKVLKNRDISESQFMIAIWSYESRISRSFGFLSFAYYIVMKTCNKLS